MTHMGEPICTDAHGVSHFPMLCRRVQGKHTLHQGRVRGTTAEESHGMADGTDAHGVYQSSSCYALQTGAGKTYTMSGEGQQYNRRGITPRALHHIFEQIDIRVDRQMIVRVSFVEVYNEVCAYAPCC